MDTLKQTLDNVVIESRFKVRFDGESEDVHEVIVSYDFEGVDVESALEPAIKKLNIKVQDILRKSFPTAEAMAANIKSEYSHSVAELLKPADRSVDPVQQINRAVGKMSPEKYNEWLAERIAEAKKAGIIK